MENKKDLAEQVYLSKMKECGLMNCNCKASFKTRLSDWVLLCEAHAELMAKYVGWGQIILAEQDAPPILTREHQSSVN